MSDTLLFDTLTQAVPGLIWIGDQDGTIRFINDQWVDYTGLSREQILSGGWSGLLHPADAEAFMLPLRSSGERGECLNSEIRIRRHDGAYHRHMISARDAGNGTWVGCAIDTHDWRATELRDETQSKILKLVIAGVDLLHLLDELCRSAERQIPGAACSILLVDAAEGKFTGGSAPNLPKGIITALTGVSIGQGVGSCGTAAFTKRDVISTDIANDPLWADCLHLALPLGFRACWSQPVISSQGEVIAAFGFYFRDSRTPTVAEAQELARIRGLATLAIERARILDALRESEEHYRYSVELSPQIPWTADPQGRIVNVSSRWAQVTGICELNGSGDGWRKGLHPEDEARATQMWATSLATGQPLDSTYRFKMSTGGYKWTRARATARFDDQGKVIRWYGTLEDVHEAYLANDKLQRQAYQDELTGLANRRKFTEVLKHCLLTTKSHVGLMVLDMDDFKLVNDLYGHLTGDAVLRLFARYLQKMTAEDDLLARLGGDEFAIISPNIRDEAHLLSRAHKIEALLETQLRKNLKTRSCRPSIGCAIGASMHNPEELFKRADLALYAAKDAGKGTVKLFDPSMRSAATRRRDAFDLARLALREQWIEPFYQPIIDLKTRQVRGFEALLRIRHPQEGILPPARIMEALDDPRLADSIGIRMIQQVIADMAPDAAIAPLRGQVSINLATENLVNTAFVDHLLALLDHHQVPNCAIKLEIRENVLLDRLSRSVIQKLEQLRASGVGIALDDFGTGYASLFHLQTLPIDEIKIDRTFVSGLGTATNKGEIVQAILGLAKALGLRTVAEGVEDQSEALRLAEWGCDFGQGYLFAHPLSAAEAKRLSQSLAASQSIPDLVQAC